MIRKMLCSVCKPEKAKKKTRYLHALVARLGHPFLAITLIVKTNIRSSFKNLTVTS